MQLNLRTVLERHGQDSGRVGGYLAVRSNPGQQRFQLRHVLHLNLQQVAGVTGDRIAGDDLADVLQAIRSIVRLARIERLIATKAVTIKPSSPASSIAR